MNIGKEVIEAIAMGVSIILLAAALLYTVGNVTYGQMMLTTASEGMEEMQYKSEEDNFRQFVREPVKIPAVAAYALIGYNQNRIDDITCSICNYVCDTDGFENTCLKDHLNGFVMVYAQIDEITMQYHLYIEEADE